MRDKHTKENFNWEEFKLYTAITSKELAEILNIGAPHMSMMVRGRWVTMPIKKKLDKKFKRKNVNKFLIGECV